MNHPRDISIKDYTYELPEERIAKYPLAERDLSRLLIYTDRKINEDIYRNLGFHLPQNALLIFNNTKVIEARILFRKPTGALIEVFALEPHEKIGNVTAAMNAQGEVWWKCLVGGAGKWKRGQVMKKQLDHPGGPIELVAEIVEKHPDYFTIRFSWLPGKVTFSEVLHLSGVMPIPPYLGRETDISDHERYQTIYAAEAGSVAAPTAGLHFTQEVFASLKARQIDTAFLTLHVSAGTFMPVKSTELAGHQMHSELIVIAQDLILKLINHPAKIFAVGTTSLRTLESLYWMGVKCMMDPGIQYEELAIKQWEVYDRLESLASPVDQALYALLHWMKIHAMESLFIKTQILIAPPYKAKMIRGLITNFHQPNSTLLLLVAALIGDDWQSVYTYALEHHFRFLSYGDGCLLFIN